MPDARDVRSWRTEDRRRHQSLADEDDISTSIKAHLKSPFKVVMRQEGLVEKIQCEMTKEESKRQDRTVQEFKQAFKTMETSISGECETHYTLAKLPATVARDLKQSEQIPESHYKYQAISAEEPRS